VTGMRESGEGVSIATTTICARPRHTRLGIEDSPPPATRVGLLDCW